MLKTFIQRPVVATVVSIILVILGIVGLIKLPVQQFPDIAPPAVQVSASYPGANAETLLRSVAPPLEEAINGVENMSYMSSSSNNDGTLSITIYFKLGTDPDQAAVNVQNRVASATGLLPAEVVQAGITTQKVQNAIIMGINLYSEDPELYDYTFLANYAAINIQPEIKRIPGVGQANLFGGSKDYSMRIWLNPAQMASYNITPNEVMAAVRSKNQEAAHGRFGEMSKQSFEYVIKYAGKYNRPEDYARMIIRSNADGSFLRLRDVAKVELDSYTYGSFNKVDDKPGVSIIMLQLPGSNSREIQLAIEELMVKAAKDFQEGIKYQILYNTKDALDQSIGQVKHTLIEAVILVFIVVFLFLQDFRSTLIPAIAVPVALIGTFFFMSLLGFSINLLTLFALVLAIGIVVDDAIVVVEAIHAKLEHSTMNAKQATLSAMHEITGAIISITLVMAAVFVPVAFMEGSAGVFYRQFSLTLAVSIVISGINALTLTPALCAIMLKDPHAKSHKKNLLDKFFDRFNAAYDSLADRYRNVLNVIASRRVVTLALLVGFLAATWGMNSVLPTGFIPTEDQGVIYVNVTSPPGATVERTESVLDEVQKIASELEVVESVATLAGYSLLTEAAGASYGMGMINLIPWDDREESVDDVIAQMQDLTKNIKGADIQYFPPPTVPGFGNASGFELRIQDRSGKDDLQETAQIINEFVQALNEAPE